MTRGLRIGVDGRELLGQPTGVGRYLSELFREWRELPRARDHAFQVFLPGEKGSGVFFPPEGTPSWLWEKDSRPLFEVRWVPGSPGTWWEQMRLPSAMRAQSLDVFFAPAYSAPMRVRLPLVLTIHDVSFAAHPEWFSWREGCRRRWLARHSARAATLVLTDAEFSKAEMVSRLAVDARRIRVIPLGTRPRGRREGTPGVMREPIVLFVGSIFTRRHLPDLIRAFALMARRDSRRRLVIVGEDRAHPPQDLEAVARCEGVADRVTLRSYMPDAGLDELYAEASVFAFLSEYEGFGLTPLEALAGGVPILVADTPIAREIYGDAALYVPQGDVQLTADTLESLMTDEAARARVLARAPAVLARYSWTRTAQETLAALEEAAGPSTFRAGKHG